MSINIFNEDCIIGSKKILDNSIDLGIYDPPFGIGESSFNKFYKRDSTNVISGYCEAPKDYVKWTLLWMAEAKRILKDNGTMYIVIGHTNLYSVLHAINELNLFTINHLIWKYNFGVNTSKKYVTSHYHILYVKKTNKSNYTFNTYCRFGQQEKDDFGSSLIYKDLEDVFIINKDFASGKIKNQNKLPNELIEKLILYSSNPNDIICDFFLGNFTTAYSALNLGRKIYGFEINDESFNYHVPLIKEIEFGNKLNILKKVINIKPINQGKSISLEDIKSICNEYKELLKLNISKKEISLKLQEKYQRGKFAIKNILDKNLTNQ